MLRVAVQKKRAEAAADAGVPKGFAFWGRLAERVSVPGGVTMWFQTFEHFFSTRILTSSAISS